MALAVFPLALPEFVELSVIPCVCPAPPPVSKVSHPCGYIPRFLLTSALKSPLPFAVVVVLDRFVTFCPCLWAGISLTVNV